MQAKLINVKIGLKINYNTIKIQCNKINTNLYITKGLKIYSNKIFIYKT